MSGGSPPGGDGGPGSPSGDGPDGPGVPGGDPAGVPFDPREERFRPMGDFLLAEVIAVMLLAAVTVLAGTRVGRGPAIGMVILLVLIPYVRVLWLVIRWAGRGDRRFAMVGVAVLLVPLAAFVISH